MEETGSIEGMGDHISKALGYLRTVAENLRSQGLNEEANRFGQVSVTLVTIFNEATMRLNESAQASPMPTLTRPQPGRLGLASSSANHGLNIMQTQQGLQTSLNPQQSVLTPATRTDHRLQAFQHLPNLPTGVETWARVASTVSEAQTMDSGLLDMAADLYQPSGGSNQSKMASEDVELLSNAGRHETKEQANRLLEEGKAGIVTVEGPIKNVHRFLHFWSSLIHEGPIYKLSIDSDSKATAIFEYYLHAQIFVDRNTESIATHGESLFGYGNWILTLGQPMEWTQTLERMCHPCRERRRLTFVRSRLFADHPSWQKWVREVEDVAGTGNVDYVWAFNTGNATAVFFTVAVARKVLETFMNWRTNRGCYKDLQVTYSSDPCEKSLVLTTQIRYHMQPPERQFEHSGQASRHKNHASGRKRQI